jgi:putative ABC transport system substrate-binding protein
MELARRSPDVIVTFGEASIRAAMQATNKIPIVMALAPDPVGTGLVANLARPGGNLTGLSALAADLAGKRLEVLKEVVPRVSRVAALWNPSNQSKVTEWRDTEAAAMILGLTLQPFEVRSRADFEPAFAAIARNRPDAVLTLTEGLTIANRERIAYFALANRLPMVAELREFTAAGGVVSYGTSRPALWRRAATYVDKILRGAKPSDLPVEQPTKFELVINLRAATAIGLEVPPLMLARADEVIE